MKTKSILFVGRGTALTAGCGHQAISLLENRRALEARGFAFTFVEAATSDEVVLRATAKNHDLVWLLFPWRDSVETVIAALKKIRTGQTGKLVLVDYTDQTCSPHWAALPYVDYFLKPFLLRDLTRYQENFAGGYLVTDFMTKELGYDIRDWYFHSALDAQHAHKIELGWNMAATDRYRRLARVGRFSLPFRLRPYDVNVRFTVGKYEGKSHWYTAYRQRALDLVAGMKGRRISGQSRLPFKRYLIDLSLSKIVVSPFGWGEVCYRDYEAVVCRSLLVKPSMEHLVTEPNIFVPNETYVPLRWDMADLAERCEHYLAHPKEAQRIIDNAYEAFTNYFKQNRVVERFTEIFE